MHLNNRKVLLGNIVILLVNLLLFYKFNVPVEPILVQPPATSTAKPETPVIEKASTENPKEKEEDQKSQKNQNLYAKFQIEDYEEIVNEIFDRNDLEKIIEKSQNLTSNIKIQAPILLETMLFQPKLILGNFYFSKKEKKDSKNIVIGIPTLYRKTGNPMVGTEYLIHTLRGLIAKLHSDTLSRVKILVFIAETEIRYRKLILADLLEHFADKIQKENLIQIIVPEKNFYVGQDLEINENFPNWGDSPDRIKWRTKQNLDYIYLWKMVDQFYSDGNGFDYFLQLEDDVNVKINDLYGEIIKRVEKNNQKLRTSMKDSWLMVDFLNQGFIAKMFRRPVLKQLIEYSSIYFQSKPCDWIVNQFITGLICSPEYTRIECNAKLGQYSFKNTIPAMFQHAGKFSSLNGQVREKNTFDSKGKPLLSPQKRIKVAINKSKIKKRKRRSTFKETSSIRSWLRQAYRIRNLLLKPVYLEPLTRLRSVEEEIDLERQKYFRSNQL